MKAPAAKEHEKNQTNLCLASRKREKRAWFLVLKIKALLETGKNTLKCKDRLIDRTDLHKYPCAIYSVTFYAVLKRMPTGKLFEALG